jgi:hypothetical protein
MRAPQEAKQECCQRASSTQKNKKPEDNKDYKKLYNQLLKKYHQVSTAYQTIKVQNETWPHQKKVLQLELESLKKNQVNTTELEDDNYYHIQINRFKEATIVRQTNELHQLQVARREKDATIKQKEEEIDELKAALLVQEDTRITAEVTAWQFISCLLSVCDLCNTNLQNTVFSFKLQATSIYAVLNSSCFEEYR